MGKEYGYVLPDTERTDDPPAKLYRSTIAYNGSLVTGFLPYPAYCNVDNIWTEGTGAMALAFYKAGYKERGDFYVSQLEKLLIRAQGYPDSIQALAYYALPSPCDPSVVPTKGHAAAAAWYIFAEEYYDPFDGTVMTSSQIGNPVVQIEAENYGTTSLVGVRYDSAGKVFEGNAIHIGGDNNISKDDSTWTQYKFNVLTSTTITAVTMRYADHVRRDGVEILLDGTSIASFNTAVPEVGSIMWSQLFLQAQSKFRLALTHCELKSQIMRTWGTTVDHFQMLKP